MIAKITLEIELAIAHEQAENLVRACINKQPVDISGDYYITDITKNYRELEAVGKANRVTLKPCKPV